LCWIRCASADTLDGEADELDIFSPRCVPARRCFSPLTDSGIFLLLLHSLAAPPVRSPRFGGACTAHPSVRPSERTIDFNKEKGRETNERSTTTASARTRAAHAPRLAATGTRSRKQSRRGCGAGTGWADVMHRPCGARPFRVGGARDFPSAGCAAPVSFWG
jgi:hypothetical protein